VIDSSEIHEREKEFIETQAQLFSIDTTPYWEDTDDDISFLRNVEMSRMNRLAIVRDCIVLGYIDGDFNEKERAKVIKIASYLKLSESDVENLENWLKELWAVLEKGKRLFMDS
jgi:tellurite resistance protein